MIGTVAPVAVILPCRNSRHLLWRSLASVAAQTLPPAQILVLDRSSNDGVGDWLRARWPGVELRTVPSEADGAAIGAAISMAVSAPIVVMLRPGDHWPRNHLEALLAEQGTGATELAPTATPGHAHGRRRTALAGGRPAVALASSTGGGDRVPAGHGGGDPARPARGCGPGRAARPAGLAALVGSSGRSTARAQPRRPRLAGAGCGPAVAPLLVSLSGPLGLARASEQLCIEELLRRAANRPVRLVLGGIGAVLAARSCHGCSDAALAHPDIELWLCDSVSRRLAVSLLGRGRVRLVSPPLLALAPILRELTEREPIQPAMLGRPEGGHDLALRMRRSLGLVGRLRPRGDPAARPGAGARHGYLAMAEGPAPAAGVVLGAGRLGGGTLAGGAWCEPATSELAMFAAMCGRDGRADGVGGQAARSGGDLAGGSDRARHRNRLKEKDL